MKKSVPRKTVQKDGPDPIDVKIGLRIRLRRKAIGISQEKLANHLEISFQQVQKYERGTNRVSGSTLARIKDFLEVDSFDYFYDNESDEKKPAEQDLIQKFLLLPGGPEMAQIILDLSHKLRLGLMALLRAMREE